jgi:hypothetical protein
LLNKKYFYYTNWPAGANEFGNLPRATALAFSVWPSAAWTPAFTWPTTEREQSHWLSVSNCFIYETEKWSHVGLHT